MLKPIIKANQKPVGPTVSQGGAGKNDGAKPSHKPTGIQISRKALK